MERGYLVRAMFLFIAAIPIFGTFHAKQIFVLILPFVNVLVSTHEFSGNEIGKFLEIFSPVHNCTI